VSDPLGAVEPPTSRRTATVVAVTFAAALCLVGLFLAVRAISGIGDEVGPAAVPSIPPQTGGVEEDEAGGPQPAPETEPVTTDPATTEAPVDDVVAFSSPSGNIGCTLSSEGARCDIAERAWDPPAAPDSCTQEWGRGLLVGPDGPAFVCTSESVLGAGEVLDYGEVLTRGDFTCVSEQDGMRCTSTTGAGFVLARASYEVL
jgi:hypothetical protein